MIFEGANVLLFYGVTKKCETDFESFFCLNLTAIKNRIQVKSIYYTLLFILFFGFSSRAQKVFSVDYQNQADVKVFVVKFENQADLKVYKVKYSNQAGQNDGRWFFTDYKNQASKTIFFVDYENQADLKIYFVAYENQSGWRNNAKRHLMY